MPISFNLVVQYYDRAMGYTRSYYNHVVHIRVKAATTLTLSTSKFDSCYNAPFPMSFGGFNGHFITYGVDVNPSDNNFVMGGRSANLTTWGDGYDGFVMRLSETGYIEWYNVITVYNGLHEHVGGVGISGSYVYALFYTETSEPANTHAIVKVTYLDGYKEWSKYVHQLDPVSYALAY